MIALAIICGSGLVTLGLFALAEGVRRTAVAIDRLAADFEMPSDDKLDPKGGVH